MISLGKKVEEFRDITLECIKRIEGEQYEAFEEMTNERGKIIESFNKIEYSQVDFAEVCEKLNIGELDRKLNELALQKREDLKKEIGNLNKSKRAHGAYNTRITNNSYFVKRKI